MPEKGTDEMVQFLHATMVDAVSDLGIKFSNGDLMTACTYLVVEAGLNEDPNAEKLLDDITDVTKKIIASIMSGGKTVQ